MTARRSFSISVLVLLSGLFVVDRLYGRYASAHYAPETTFRLAVAQGDGCVVAVGDSRMVAGVDLPTFARTLSSDGGVCMATLATGALKLTGQVIVLRRYLEQRRPATVVVGVSEGTLLPEPERDDPSSLVGNRALELAWSNGDERTALYPTWDLDDVDAHFRHTLLGATALGSYASLASFRLQSFEDQLLGPGLSRPVNRFGLLSDMQALEASFRGGALEALARWDGRFPRSPWLERARELARARGARLVVVAVPMPSAYRTVVGESPPGRRYHRWLEQNDRAGGEAYVNLSAAVADEHFLDGMHLGPSGAKQFSELLARRLVERGLASRPQP